MLAESSPVVARWELSRRLASRRKELRVDVKTITDALGFTRNYWSAVENDRTLIAEDKLRLLFDVLSFPAEEHDELLQLREDSRKRGWWDEYPSLNEHYKRFYGMEAGTSCIRAYSGHLVPGVLQTDNYARAIVSLDPGYRPVEIDRIVALRRERRQRLLADNAPKLTILISEAVLHQQVGGVDVQVEQLRYVLDLATTADDLLTVRVLPFDLNPGAIVNSTALHFFEYDNDHLPTTAWQEGVELFDGIDDDEEAFERLDFAWEYGLRRSLDRTASLTMVHEAAAAFERRAQPST